MKLPYALVIAALIASLIIALPALYVVLTGDYPGSAMFYGVMEDDPIVDALISLSQRVR